MKIAIQGHPTRGKEVIQILESLGGKNLKKWHGDGDIRDGFFIDNDGSIKFNDLPKGYKLYTLEEFEKEFPFKIGDKVIDYEGDVATITGFAYIEENLGYSLQYENGRGTATPRILTPYKEMNEERNITLTLDKAKEWYKKGGELREIALQAFTEKELIVLPKSWEEFCQKYPIQDHEAFINYANGDITICKECAGSGLGVWKRKPEKDRCKCVSQKSAEAHLAMIQLEQLRNCWWNGWKPEWHNSEKYVIKWEVDNLIVFTARRVHAFLVFPTREMAEEFLKCFRDLIEKARDLI